MVGCMVLMNTQNVILGVAVILVIGMLVGLVNGVLIGYLQLPAFIVTLGTMQICRSLDYVISNANTASKFPAGQGQDRRVFPGVHPLHLRHVCHFHLDYGQDQVRPVFVCHRLQLGVCPAYRHQR